MNTTKKILIINGSLRSIGQTKRVIDLLSDKLKEKYQIEIINLKEENLKNCLGCAICLSRGENFCPLVDDRNLILKKMDEADGIIFATPNFALHVTHLMKNFLDRHAFIYHRPRLFKKIFTSVVTQGVFGGKKINQYFKTTVGFWGGIYIPGIVLTLVSAAYAPSKIWNEKESRVVNKKIDKLIEKFCSALENETVPQPSIFRLMMFRLTRSAHKYSGEDNKDVNHFREMGWFESDYWYPVKLNIILKSVGILIDYTARKLVLKK